MVDQFSLSSAAQFGGEMSELDDAGTYFDLGPRKVTRRGTYLYMCSRNNNFTNRSQKGKVIVGSTSIASKRIGWNGGTLSMGRCVCECVCVSECVNVCVSE